MSKDGKEEYSATVVRVGELKPIEGSDFLVQTYIGDASIVVRKDEVNEGDLMFYVSNECQICERFLSVNNLFDVSCYEKNSNHTFVEKYVNDIERYKKLLETDLTDEDRAEYTELIERYKGFVKIDSGFFSSNGRVRMIKLRKTPSMGFLFGMNAMEKFCNKVRDVNLEEYVNVSFDTIDGELFVKAYVPPVKERPMRSDKTAKRNKKLKRFDRMIDGEFSFHYDTKLLGKYIGDMKPTDIVSVTVKLHGSSLVSSKIKVKNPIKLPFYKSIWNKAVDKFGVFKSTRFTDYEITYDNIYSSRTVIKNQFINKDVTSGFYDYDIWKEANDVLKPYLSDGMTVYAEICGYAGNKMIQKGYDYGCKSGEFFVMPYRITTKEDGKKYEWDVLEVESWTNNILNQHPELSNKIHAITVLYHGSLRYLYPELSTSTHWNENVLQAMINDKKNFGMEELEPLCNNKVPREGIVLRIDKDPCAEAFKLKTNAFRMREAKQIDEGNADAEMSETYDNNNTEA